MPWLLRWLEKIFMKAITFLTFSLLAALTASGAVSLDAGNENSVMLDTDPAMKKVGQADAETPAGKALVAFAAGEHDKAVEMAKPLAIKGDPLALYIMGFAHESGQGAEASAAKAVDFYRRGAEKDHAESIYRLSFILLSYGVASSTICVDALSVKMRLSVTLTASSP